MLAIRRRHGDRLGAGRPILLLLTAAGLVGLMDNLLHSRCSLVLTSFGGLAYIGFLGLFLVPIILAVVLETLRSTRKNINKTSRA